MAFKNLSCMTCPTKYIKGQWFYTEANILCITSSPKMDVSKDLQYTTIPSRKDRSLSALKVKCENFRLCLTQSVHQRYQQHLSNHATIV